MVDTVVNFELTLSWADLMPLARRFSSTDIIFTIEDLEVLKIWISQVKSSSHHEVVLLSCILESGLPAIFLGENCLK